MTKEKALKIIEAYDALVDRALRIVSAKPWRVHTENEENARVSIDGDNLIFTWPAYESDYYGGGYMRIEQSSLPLDVFFLDDEVISSQQAKVRKEDEDRAEKVRQAQAAVKRERAEAHDRAEWARLRQKFGDWSK